MSISLFVALLGLSAPVLAQQQNDDVGQQFHSRTDDASLVYGLILPSGINGMSNLMSLWGGRYGFKISSVGELETQLLLGAGNAQKYYQIAPRFRADIPLDDMMASLYVGIDIQDIVTPVYDQNGNAIDSSAAWYLGIHFGGALWWEITTDFYLRTDLQLDYGPGTSLLVLLSGAYRWGAGGGG